METRTVRKIIYNLINNFNHYFSDYQSGTKISKDTPSWFNVCPEWKKKQFDDYLTRNEDTMRVLSKHQNWITINTKSRNRNKPLERMKIENMEKTSKIMPKWMETKFSKSQGKGKENFKLIEYYPIKQKCKKQMAYVDKVLNPPKNKHFDYFGERSVFSYGDFRHNVLTEKERKFCDGTVSNLPKKFFDWDDGKTFNPKYKKDI